MRNQVHILNGDALKEQFPKAVTGDILVARECLVDGNVKGHKLSDFFQTRANFISTHYEGVSKADYFEKTVPQFEKMQNIPAQTDIHLWFEEDLFCQVNFWFVLTLIFNTSKGHRFFLVRPTSSHPYNFGALHESELLSVYERKTELKQLDILTQLWSAYQADDSDQLISLAKRLKESYPFILAAVNAHLERIPEQGELGRPTDSLITIMKELDTQNFTTVFKAFHQREAIYGFGDLQVKRLYDQIINSL